MRNPGISYSRAPSSPWKVSEWKEGGFPARGRGVDPGPRARGPGRAPPLPPPQEPAPALRAPRSGSLIRNLGAGPGLALQRTLSVGACCCLRSSPPRSSAQAGQTPGRGHFSWAQLETHRMQWALLLLLAGLCSLSQAQYDDDDSQWWFHYLRSQQRNTYYDPYDPYPYEHYEPYPYGVEEGPAYAYGGSPSPPEPRDCPQECDCPPNFPTAMYCDNRNLKYLPFVPSRMKYVYFQNNQITAIQEGVFDNATGLLWIALHGNQITSDKVGRRVFSKLRHLERLYLDHNNLTRVPGPLPRSLRELHLNHNQITRVPNSALEGLENLTALYLQHNDIQEVGSSMRGLRSLILLDLSYNHLRRVPDGLPSALEQLYLEHNNVYTMPDSYFRGSPKLLYVRLSHNSLTNGGLASNTFNSSSLLELDLSYNQLQKIPPVSTNLENLYLQGNRINEFSISSFCTVVDVMNFSKLQVLRLDGNEINRSAMPADAPLCLRLASLIEI